MASILITPFFILLGVSALFSFLLRNGINCHPKLVNVSFLDIVLLVKNVGVMTHYQTSSHCPPCVIFEKKILTIIPLSKRISLFLTPAHPRSLPLNLFMFMYTYLHALIHRLSLQFLNSLSLFPYLWMILLLIWHLCLLQFTWWSASSRRNPLRSCHPPARYCTSATTYSPEFLAFISTINSQHEPKSYYETIKSPEWQHAMNEELQHSNAHILGILFPCHLVQVQ